MDLLLYVGNIQFHLFPYHYGMISEAESYAFHTCMKKQSEQGGFRMFLDLSCQLHPNLLYSRRVNENTINLCKKICRLHVRTLL